MRTSEIVKKIDSQGRITIPLTFRRELNIQDEDELAIECDDNKILIKKKRNLCCACHTEIPFNCWICPECLEKIKGDSHDSI